MAWANSGLRDVCAANSGKTPRKYYIYMICDFRVEAFRQYIHEKYK